MRMPAGGRLLEKVAYCMRKPCKSTNIIDEEIEVRDTFPYNPDSKTAPETARRWAENYTWYDRRDNTPKYEPEVLVRDNTPFTVTITDLHVRSEGGRAYKVIDSEMRRFDLREDQVLEVMRLVGIKPMGIVPGEFVWGILGSQVRLVLVGGELHKSMIEGLQERKDFAAAQASGLLPTESTLRFGRIYRKKDKSLHLFIGRVKRPGSDKTLYAFVSMPAPPPTWDDVDFEKVDHHNAHWVLLAKAERATAQRWDSMTWAERCQWEWYDLPDFTQRQYPELEPGYYHRPGAIVLMSSPKFEAEDGEATELAEQILKNEGSKHMYANGHGEDLAETEWSKANGDARRERYHESRSWWNISHEERKKLQREHRMKLKAEITATRMAFQKQLTWL